MYLLDTEVVLELRRAKAGKTDEGLARWAAGVSHQSLFLSALSLLELHNRAATLHRSNKSAGNALRGWIDEQVLRAFGDRILPVDKAVVQRSGQLAQSSSRDGLLMATALEHGLTLVTRNATSFKAARLKTFSPWGYEADPDASDADWSRAGRNGSLWLKNLFVRS